MLAKAEQLLQRGSSVSGSLLPAIFAIFKQWQLTGVQQMTLLGLTNEKTLYNWKNQPEKAKLTRDCLERASYILGIYRALQVLFPDEAQSAVGNSHLNYDMGRYTVLISYSCNISSLDISQSFAHAATRSPDIDI